MSGELTRACGGCRVPGSEQELSTDNNSHLFLFLQKEKERIMENKRQVQSLVNKSRTIVRLKSRNPEEKSSSPVLVQALCDFKQDQVRCLLPPTHQTTCRGPEDAVNPCHSSLCPLLCSFPERYLQRERGPSEGQLAAQQVACDGTWRSGYADPLRVFVNPPSKPSQRRPRQQVRDSRRQHLCASTSGRSVIKLPFFLFFAISQK